MLMHEHHYLLLCTGAGFLLYRCRQDPVSATSQSMSDIGAPAVAVEQTGSQQNKSACPSGPVQTADSTTCTNTTIGQQHLPSVATSTHTEGQGYDTFSECYFRSTHSISTTTAYFSVCPTDSLEAWASFCVSWCQCLSTTTSVYLCMATS